MLDHIDMMEQLICSGCGIEMQFKYPEEVGYCTPEALAKVPDPQLIAASLICQRCFHIRHYGHVTNSKRPYEEYEKRVKALKHRDMLIVQLVDLLDIQGSLLGTYVYVDSILHMHTSRTRERDTKDMILPSVMQDSHQYIDFHHDRRRNIYSYIDNPIVFSTYM
jgi:hypothetical protein